MCFNIRQINPPPPKKTITPHPAAGSGKSSLLNALAGRVAFVKGAKLEGQVFINGAAIDYALMPKICGTCVPFFFGTRVEMVWFVLVWSGRV